MNIESKQIEIVRMLLTVRDNDTLEKVKGLLKTFRETDSVSHIQYNKELDDAERRIDAGEFTTQEQVELEAKKW